LGRQDPEEMAFGFFKGIVKKGGNWERNAKRINCSRATMTSQRVKPFLVNVLGLDGLTSWKQIFERYSGRMTPGLNCSFGESRKNYGGWGNGSLVCIWGGGQKKTWGGYYHGESANLKLNPKAKNGMGHRRMGLCGEETALQCQ